MANTVTGAGQVVRGGKAGEQSTTRGWDEDQRHDQRAQNSILAGSKGGRTSFRRHPGYVERRCPWQQHRHAAARRRNRDNCGLADQVPIRCWGAGCQHGTGSDDGAAVKRSLSGADVRRFARRLRFPGINRGRSKPAPALATWGHSRCRCRCRVHRPWNTSGQTDTRRLPVVWIKVPRFPIAELPVHFRSVFGHRGACASRACPSAGRTEYQSIRHTRDCHKHASLGVMGPAVSVRTGSRFGCTVSASVRAGAEQSSKAGFQVNRAMNRRLPESGVFWVDPPTIRRRLFCGRYHPKLRTITTRQADLQRRRFLLQNRRHFGASADWPYGSCGFFWTA